MRAKTIYFVAGESSGDNHGAALMRSLRRVAPDLRFIGRGGPQMQAVAGSEFRNWIDRAAVVGLWEVIKNYGFFRQQFREALREIDQARPDAVVLIDYPGFNLRLSRELARRKDHPRLLYYISPQVWAWNRGRIKHMAKWLDLMICIFPFEEELYNRSGLRTIFVGHPMHERLEAQRSGAARDRNLVALFPGSRRREVKKILPIMLKAYVLLRRRFPALRFEIAAASRELAEEIRQHVGGGDAPVIRVSEGRAAAAMQEAWVGIVASGSATLEAAWFRLPFVLVYKVSWLTYMAGRMVIKVDYLGMPNVLAGRAVVPEFIQHEASPAAIADEAGHLLEDEAARQEMISAFDDIVHSLGEGGASDRAAAVIAQELESNSAQP